MKFKKIEFITVQIYSMFWCVNTIGYYVVQPKIIRNYIRFFDWTISDMLILLTNITNRKFCLFAVWMP